MEPFLSLPSAHCQCSNAQAQYRNAGWLGNHGDIVKERSAAVAGVVLVYLHLQVAAGGNPAGEKPLAVQRERRAGDTVGRVDNFVQPVGWVLEEGDPQTDGIPGVVRQSVRGIEAVKREGLAKRNYLMGVGVYHELHLRIAPGHADAHETARLLTRCDRRTRQSQVKLKRPLLGDGNL